MNFLDKSMNIQKFKILCGTCLIFFLSMGIAYNCRSIYLTEAMKNGVISGEMMSFFWLITALLIFFGAFFALFIISQIGLCNTIFAGGCLMGAGYILLCYATAPQSLLFSSFLMGIGGVLTGKISVQMVVLNTFFERKNFYLGILSAAAGLGAVIGSPLLAQIILAWGWRNACLYTGITVIIVSAFCCYLLIKNQYEYSKSTNDIHPVFTPQQKKWVVIIAICTCCCNIIPTGILTFFQPILAEKGMDIIKASQIYSVYALTGVINGIASGNLADRFGFKSVFLFCSACGLTGLMLVYFGSSAPLFFLAAFLIGTWGVMANIFPLNCAAKIFPREVIQKIQSYIIAAGAVSIILTSLLAGIIYSLNHSYLNFILIMLFFFFIAAYLIIILIKKSS